MLLIASLAAAAFILTFIYSSFFEWTLHRYFMHDNRFMNYAYEAHQLEHHEIFKADDTYFFDNEPHTEEDLRNVTFAWWNAPLLFTINLPIFIGFFFATRALGGNGWIEAVASFAAMVSYYALYEYFHYCMHVRGERKFEKSKVFQFVNNHHRLHHVFYRKNLNVVFPIADTILGTRVRMEDHPDLFNKLQSVRDRRSQRANSDETQRDSSGESPVAAAVGGGDGKNSY